MSLDETGDGACRDPECAYRVEIQRRTIEAEAELEELAEAAQAVLGADGMLARSPSHSATRRWDFTLQGLHDALARHRERRGEG